MVKATELTNVWATDITPPSIVCLRILPVEDQASLCWWMPVMLNGQKQSNNCMQGHRQGGSGVSGNPLN